MEPNQSKRGKRSYEIQEIDSFSFSPIQTQIHTKINEVVVHILKQ